MPSFLGANDESISRSPLCAVLAHEVPSIVYLGPVESFMCVVMVIAILPA